MRINRHRYLTHLLVLSAILVSITLLVANKAYADDGVTVLDDIQPTVVENVSAEESDSVGSLDQFVQTADESQVQTPDGGQVSGQGGAADGSSALPDAGQDATVATDDATDGSDVTLDGNADVGAATDTEADSEATDGAGDAVAAEAAATVTESDATEGVADETAEDPQMLATQATTTNASMNGVDISGWNVGVDFSKLGDFVIIKATQWNPSSGTYTYWTSGGNGNGNGSLSYTQQADAALKAGKLLGFYHFFVSPNYGGSTGKKASAVDQAKGFLNAVSVKDSNGNYKYLGQALLVLDWEDTGYSSIESHVSWAKEWLDYVYNQTGIKPVIYMNYNCANQYNWSSVANAGYELWGARYFYKYYYDAETGRGTKIKNFVSNPDMYASNDTYNRWGAWGTKPLMYQYTASCNLHGSNNYDANKFYGSKLDWLKLALGAREISSSATEAAKFLTNNAVYKFSPTRTAERAAYSSADNGVLGSTNYRNGYWIVKNLGEGLYRFVNFGTGKNLSFSPASGKVSNGVNVVTTGSVDTWRLIKCSNGSFALVPNGYSSYRLDVSGGKIIDSGANLQLYTGNGSVAQRFFFTKSASLTEAFAAGKALDTGIYTFKSNLDGSKTLDVRGASTANGANVQIYGSNNSFAQRFKVSYKGNGLYTIEVFKSGKVLDVAGGSTANGANVQQYTANSTLAQYWYVKKAGSLYTFLSAKSGKALDIAGAKTANGTNVQIYTSNNSKAQRFSLVHDTALEESCASGKAIGEGIYTFASVFAPTRVLDIKNASKANGANVQLYSANGTLAQKFELSYMGNGLYTIRSAMSGKVLDIASANMNSGANVQQYQSNGTRAQAWYFVKKNDVWMIRSALNGKAISLQSDSDANGVNICMKDANTAAESQQFAVQQAPLFEDGVYTVKSSLGNYRLSVTNASTAEGGNVQIWSTSTNLAQQWKLTHLGSGVYSITNVNSELAMEVANASNASKANIQQAKYKGTTSQKWVFTVTSTGAVCIRNLASGLVLDVAGAKKADGTNVQQYASNGSAAQSFVLTAA